MSLLQIRKIGDPVLRTKAKKIDEITKKINDLIDNMFETMYAEGLEARAIQHEIDHLDGILFIDKVVKIVD